eukprot:COSAG01_NODE_26692_length_705_cov_611.508251_1_plen_151_part_10
MIHSFTQLRAAGLHDDGPDDSAAASLSTPLRHQLETIRLVSADARHCVYATPAAFGGSLAASLGSAGLSAAAVLAEPDMAQEGGKLRNGAQMRGALGVVRRGGGVTFVSKARTLALCGCVAVLVVNTDDEPFLLHASDADDGRDILVPVMC